MMTRTLLMLAALASICLPATAAAKNDAAADFQPLKAGIPLKPRPDRAYLLLRIDRSAIKPSAFVLRVPSDGEMAAYEAARQAAYEKHGKGRPLASFVFDYKGRPNLFSFLPSQAYASSGKVSLMIAEVTPGDYVLYGLGLNRSLYQCFCLGTVGFSAPAGVVTDIGTMISGRASDWSPHPELAGEADLGPSASIDYHLFAAALRPYRPGDLIPGALAASGRTSARFRAVGPYVEGGTTLINRLAPIPGVLAYDGGRVMDVASGREAPQQ